MLLEVYMKNLLKKTKDFFMELYNSNCPKIAVENPIPSKVYGLPPYTQIIQPYEFGHPYSKKTCLWLKGLPAIEHDPKDYVEGSKYFTAPSGRRYPDWCQKTGGGCGVKRSKTFPGIAKAMAEQWLRYLLSI